ncbi:MAG: S8 family serine peptidase [Bacteroidota bacterium]
MGSPVSACVTVPAISPQTWAAADAGRSAASAAARRRRIMDPRPRRARGTRRTYRTGRWALAVTGREDTEPCGGVRAVWRAPPRCRGGGTEAEGGGQACGDFATAVYAFGGQTRGGFATSIVAVGGRAVSGLGDATGSGRALRWESTSIPSPMRLSLFLRCGLLVALFATLVVPSASAQFVPNDPYYDGTEGFYNNGQWHLPEINMPLAWEIASGDSSIVVAVIESAHEIMHPELSGNLWVNLGESPLPNGSDEDGNGCEDDYHGCNFNAFGGPRGRDTDLDGGGHGAAVSGLLLARTGNATGVASPAGGMDAPGVRLMSLARENTSGVKAQGQVARAIEYAVNMGADIINMSFKFTVNSDSIIDAVIYAYNNNVLMIASRGNTDSQNVGGGTYPALYPEVMSVAAVGEDGIYSDKNGDLKTGIDLFAPGGEDTIFTLWSLVDTGPRADPVVGYTTTFGGTSASAPLVTAVAALIRSMNPALSVDTVRSIIESTADPAGCELANGDPCRASSNGTSGAIRGRLDAYAALVYTLENHGGTLRQDVTVPAGETWNLGNVTLAFEPGHRLIVEGTLNADGTTFTASDPAQGWGGIRYEDGSGGTLMGGTRIQRVSGWTGTAVTITDASPVLDSLFINTPRSGAVVTGVRITGSDAYPTLNKVDINGMTYDGIVIDGAARARLTDNVVTNTTGEGLQAGFNTETFLYPSLEADSLRTEGNRFEDNTGDGFRATDGNHTFGYYYYPQGGYHNRGYNSFDSNSSRGVEAGYGVTIHAGSSVYVQKDRNRFVSNTIDDVYADAATIYAECDWWGPTPPPFNNTTTVNGGVIDDSHWLDADPYAPGSNPTCITSVPKTSGTTRSASKTSSAYDVLRDVQAEDPALALETLQSVVAAGGPEAAMAVRELAVLGAREDIPTETLAGVETLLEATVSTGAPDLRDAARYTLVRLRQRVGDLRGALTQAEALATEAASPGASIAAQRAQVYLLADLGRPSEARSALAVLEELAPASSEVEMARLRVADLTGEAAPAPEPARGLSAKSDPVQTATGETEVDFGIRPNPASGAVSLGVTLPNDAEVRVTIHDVLGREVAAPLTGMLRAGRHAATVDASAFAPGVYLVRASIRTEGATPEVRVERLTVVR